MTREGQWSQCVPSFLPTHPSVNKAKGNVVTLNARNRQRVRTTLMKKPHLSTLHYNNWLSIFQIGTSFQPMAIIRYRECNRNHLIYRHKELTAQSYKVMLWSINACIDTSCQLTVRSMVANGNSWLAEEQERLTEISLNDWAMPMTTASSKHIAAKDTTWQNMGTGVSTRVRSEKCSSKNRYWHGDILCLERKVYDCMYMHYKSKVMQHGTVPVQAEVWPEFATSQLKCRRKALSCPCCIHVGQPASAG